MTKLHHRTYHEHRVAYDKIRDVIAGEDRLKNQGSIYLPKPEGMTVQQYKDYVSGGSFYALPFVELCLEIDVTFVA